MTTVLYYAPAAGGPLTGKTTTDMVSVRVDVTDPVTSKVSETRISLSVHGLLNRLASGSVSRAQIAAAGYLLPYRPDTDAPWGWLPAVRAPGPDGYDVALIAPAPEPAPPPIPEPPPPPPPPTLAQAQAAALEALHRAREARLSQGWYTRLDLGAGEQWYHYLGDPAEDRGLIAGAVLIARDAIAAGMPDASPYRCASLAELADGRPELQRMHTAAQLAQALAAGGVLIAMLGRLYDVARAEIEASTDATDCASVAAVAAMAMAGAAVPPELEL